jgi:hypothetical protein
MWDRVSLTDADRQDMDRLALSAAAGRCGASVSWTAECNANKLHREIQWLGFSTPGDGINGRRVKG